ncbi:acetyltransferase [Streptomyces sp. RB6PN25]|uniref:Acetyltransferase n=1 Tax=Streptomyces humicola TaxID=2953240 RepID=A0ABT1PQ93_9ACTN|nr:acyltransferase family protein [Streptomyces humicola]MCQ4079836.1 acetyltransferase [Streptomyces humicola]
MSIESLQPAPEPAPEPVEAARVRGLDGLRAPAVASVVVYHLGAPWLPGGFLGVDLFFVISGYLITSLLTAECRRSGRFRMRAFWVRRARRLLPALWAMLTAAACAATLTGGDAWAGLRGNAVAALTYSSNWWQIAQHDTYFAQFGAKPVLQHLWSLAVEEQFYLLWPLLLWVVMAAVRRQRHQAVCAAALAAVSFTAMGLLYTPDADPSRVYYGTDTHGGALLLGAAAALLLPLGRAATLRGTDRLRTMDLLGAAGLVVLACAAALFDGTGAVAFRGGLVVACLASVALTVAAAGPGLLGRALSWGPLVWVGRRSYGIYLWHWPVIATLANTLPDAATTAPVRIAALAVTAVLATASYRWLEEPVIRLGMRGYLRVLRARHRALAAVRPRQAHAVALTGVGVVGVALVGVARAPSDSGLQAQIEAGARAAAAAGGAPHGEGAPPRGAAPVTTDMHPRAADDPDEQDRPDQDDASATFDGKDITAVGDSVMLASAGALEKQFPGAEVDAEVGRQMAAAPGLLGQLLAQGRLRRTVVIGLGANGPFPDSVLDRIVRIAGPARTVAFVNVHLPRPWQNEVNAALARAARTHPTVLVVDWNGTVAGRDDQLWSDHTHPRPSGAALYAGAVDSALRARQR